MRRLDRYILTSVVKATLLTLVVVTTLSFVLTFMDEAGDAGRGDYGLGDVFLVVATMMPRFIYEAFPVAGLIGALLALGGMAAHHELVAMRAAGMSPAQMMGAMARTAVPLVGLLLVLGEWIGPPLERWGQTYRLERMNRQVAFDSRHGFWVRDRDTFVNVQGATPDGRLRGVRIYRVDGVQRLRRVTVAETGLFEEGRWRLLNVRQSRIDDEKVRTRRLDRMDWRTVLDPEMLSFALIRPKLQPALEIHRQLEALRAAGQRTVELALAFWGKVATPVTLVVMLLLAVPLVSGVHRRAHPGQQILTGALIGGVFYLLAKGFYYAVIVFGLPPVSVALFPVAAFLTTLAVLKRLGTA